MTLLASYLTIMLGLFIMIIHPLPLVIVLIFQTLSVIIKMVYLMETPWMAYITFLVYLGGLLVIFIYLSAMIPNEIFYMNSMSYFLLTSPTFVIFFNEMLLLKNSSSLLSCFVSQQNLSSIVYLLFYVMTLLCIVMYLSISMKSPLKQNNY